MKITIESLTEKNTTLTTELEKADELKDKILLEFTQTRTEYQDFRIRYQQLQLKLQQAQKKSSSSGLGSFLKQGSFFFGALIILYVSWNFIQEK